MVPESAFSLVFFCIFAIKQAVLEFCGWSRPGTLILWDFSAVSGWNWQKLSCDCSYYFSMWSSFGPAKITCGILCYQGSLHFRWCVLCALVAEVIIASKRWHFWAVMTKIISPICPTDSLNRYSNTGVNVRSNQTWNATRLELDVVNIFTPETWIFNVSWSLIRCVSSSGFYCWVPVKFL